MSLAAGSLDRKVTILRRSVSGANLGGWVTYAQAWGNFRQLAEQDAAVSGFAFTVKQGVLMVRDSLVARTVSSADRIIIDTEEYEVRSASVPDWRAGSIRWDVASAPTRSVYAERMSRNGETITVRRRVSGGSPIEALVRAWVVGFSPEELVAGINQADRKIIALVADLEAAGWPLPIRRNDQVVVRGRTMNVEDVDDNSHRYAGVLNAYQLRVTG